MENNFSVLCLVAWDQAPQWGKKEKKGVKWEKGHEWSNASPVVGWEWGKGGIAWRHALMLPFHNTRIWNHASSSWLVKCLHVGRFVVLLTVLCSFNVNLLLFGKQYKFLCETFCSSLSSKKSKKYICDRLEEENLSIQNVKLFWYSPVINNGHIYKWLTHKPIFKRNSIIITFLPKAW